MAVRTYVRTVYCTRVQYIPKGSGGKSGSVGQGPGGGPGGGPGEGPG